MSRPIIFFFFWDHLENGALNIFITASVLYCKRIRGTVMALPSTMEFRTNTLFDKLNQMTRLARPKRYVILKKYSTFGGKIISNPQVPLQSVVIILP
jgi:hypothetical protein